DLGTTPDLGVQGGRLRASLVAGSGETFGLHRVAGVAEGDVLRGGEVALKLLLCRGGLAERGHLLGRGLPALDDRGEERVARFGGAGDRLVAVGGEAGEGLVQFGADTGDGLL